MNIQLKKLHLLIQHLTILQLRHTSFITQSLKEIHSGRETGLIDTGPLPLYPLPVLCTPGLLWLMPHSFACKNQDFGGPFEILMGHFEKR